MARTAARPHAGSAALFLRCNRLLGWAGLALALGTACRSDDQLLYVAPKKSPTLAPADLAPPVTAVVKPSVVLLRRQRGRLLVLACYDETSQMLAAGDACVALLPAQTEVRLADAHTARIRRASPFVCHTPAGDVTHPSFTLLDGPPADAAPNPGPPLALWSSGPRPKLELPPEPPEAVPLPPSERQAIHDTARLLLPPAQRLLLGDVTIDSVWVVDLDADGMRERLDQVRLFDSRGRFAMLTGVFVVAGQEAVALRPLRVQIVPQQDRESLGPDDRSYDTTLLAAIDLDHDSRRELWLQLKRPGFTTDTVGRFTDTGLAAFAELTCQTDEVPARKNPATPPAAALSH